MPHLQENSANPFYSRPLRNTMLIGAGVGLVLITLFLISAGQPNPAWGDYWRIRPMVVLPVAGALGALFLHFMLHQRFRNEWVKLLGILIGLIGFIAALWLGSVFGLNGTYWN